METDHVTFVIHFNVYFNETDINLMASFWSLVDTTHYVLLLNYI